MSVLVVAEHRRGQVLDLTYELISAAAELGGPIDVAVIASDPTGLDLDREGVDTVCHVHVRKDEFENDVYQRAVETLIAERSPASVLLGFTIDSMSHGPAIAAKLGFGFASDVFELRSEGDRVTAVRVRPFLLSIGRGIGERENIHRFDHLATRLGATLSVSRPLVDAGWVPSARQVGQSGKTVKPRVYLALGISGAVQHLAGMRAAETIIGVNSDPEAPIFGVAHYGAVADLFEVADELEQVLG